MLFIVLLRNIKRIYIFCVFYLIFTAFVFISDEENKNTTVSGTKAPAVHQEKVGLSVKF